MEKPIAAPALTVVVPVCNAEPHLTACIESLLAQTFTDFELLLVDNGSTDGSRQRCARYAGEHPGRIRLLTLDTPSVSAARNAGIDAARGRFITFMDADDWAEKEFLAEFFRGPLPDAETIVLQGIVCDFTEAPGWKGDPLSPLFRYEDGTFRIGDDPATAMARRLLQDGCSVCKLYDRQMLRRNGLRFLEHLYSREDHLFFFTCLRCVRTVVWRRGMYMHYMRRMTHTLSTRPMDAERLLEAADRLEAFIPELAGRFGIDDAAYLLQLRKNLVADTLVRAGDNMRLRNARATLRALARRRALFEAAGYAPRSHPLLTRRIMGWILHSPALLRPALYPFIALRRSTLWLRGHFPA